MLKLLPKLMLLVLLACASVAHAAPFSVQYGGRLTDATGKPIAGPVNIRIKFYDQATAGALIPVTVPDMDGVVLSAGMFAVDLGLSEADYNTLFGSATDVWVEVKDATHNKTYPRQRFSAVPYALKVPVDPNTLTYDNDGKLTLSAPLVDGMYLSSVAGELSWQPLTGGGNMSTSTYDLGGVAGVVDDADKLEGQAASYYTNATNITSGTLPDAQIPAAIARDAEIPAAARGAVSATAPLSYVPGTGVFSMTAASGVSDGYLSSGNFVTFNNKQAGDATLSGIAALSPTANQLVYASGADTFSTTGLTSFGRDLLDDASVAAQRTTLGLGTMATQDAGTVAITGGTITGVTLTTPTFANDSISGDKVDGGTISNFASTGIDDNAAATAVTVDASGKVGIGTTAPNLALHVHTPTAGVSQIQITNTDSGTTASDGVAIGLDATERAIVWNGENTDMAFFTNAASRMTIAAGGNVGIGTSVPASPLSVSYVPGLPTADTYDWFSNAAAIGLNISAPSVTNDQVSALALSYGGDGWVMNAGARSNNVVDLQFTRFNSFSQARTPAVTFKDSGNVGIGTTTPGSLLDVKGTLRLSGATSGYVGFAPPATAGSTTYTLPSAPVGGGYLTTDGAGLLTWGTPAGVGGLQWDGGATNLVAATGRTSLGLVIGTNVQAYDATLAGLAATAPTADQLVYANGADTFTTTGLTSFGRDLLDDASVAAQRTTLGLTIGTNVQAYDATLGGIAATAPVADQLVYANGADTFATTGLTSFGRDLLDDASIAAQRTTLGLGTMATQAASSVAITGGSISGVTFTPADDSLSGNKVDGGTISNFASTGIDDNASATAVTIDAAGNVGIGVPAPLQALAVSGNQTTSGYLSIGSNSAPANTSAGDLTAKRLFSASTTPGSFATISGSLNNTSVSTVTGASLITTLSPASNSDTQFRSQVISTMLDTASNFTSSGLIASAFFENRVVNSGTINDANGFYSNGLLLGATAATLGTVTNTSAGFFKPVNSFTNSVASTVTTARGVKVADSSKGSLTITNQAGVSVDALAAATNNTAILLGQTSVPAGNYQIYSAGTDKSYFAGDIGIGSTSPTAALQVAAGTLPADGSRKAVATTATISTPTTSAYGETLNVSTSGTASNKDIHAENITLGAGLTGSNRTGGLQIFNQNAGTGAMIGWGDVGNYGLLTRTDATTTGHNAGVQGLAGNGDYNYGVSGIATSTKAGARNIGVWGQARNTTGYQVGGYFSLSDVGAAGVSTNSAALMADNGGETSPIFLGMDNGAQVFSIVDGGSVGIGSSVTPVASAQLEMQSTTKGFLPPRMTTVQRDAISSPATGLVVFNTTTNKLNVYDGVSWGLPTVAPDYLWVVDQKASGTDAGGSATSWTTRALNTTLADSGSNIVSVAANVVTLKPGTYECEASAPARSSNGHFIRLWNVTGGAVVARSTTGNSSVANDYTTVKAQFTIAANTGFRIDHIVNTAQATNGFGQAANIAGQVEYYASLRCNRIQ